MSTPALIYLAFTFIGVGVVAALHNQPRTGKYNFWAHLIATILSLALLWSGGFFASATP